MKAQPVVMCGLTEGSGSVLSLAVYTSDRAVFGMAGVQEGVLEVATLAESGPPDLIVTGKRQWLDHKLDPWVTERFTFTWRDGTYALAKHERMADWTYHLARFDRFLADGNLEAATREMADPPAEGLAAYLHQNAPALKASAAGPWTTEGLFSPGGAGRTYLHRPRTEGAPWFWFEFSRDGLIKAIGEQAGAPR